MSHDLNPFDEIVGERLSSVEFVLNDYVQLRFDGPTLSAYNWPVVTAAGQTFRWDEPGYRDALCERICSTVQAAGAGDDEIVLQFSDGASVTISTRAEDTVGAEAASFVGQSEAWVWQV